jgi:hypothetical protein
MLKAITFCPFKNESILHILIHTSTVHLSLPLFAAAKCMIVSLKITGTSFGNILPCSRTPYPPLTFLLIWFMLIKEPTWSITIRPSSLTSFILRHHKCQNLCMTKVTLDKRSRDVWLLKPPSFLFHFFVKEIVQASFGNRQNLVEPLHIISHHSVEEF